MPSRQSVRLTHRERKHLLPIRAYYDMIEGTTVENFQCNCGGWDCRHQLVPVHELAVPVNIRAKFAKPTTPEPAKPKEYWSEKTKNAIKRTKIIADLYGVDSTALDNKSATEQEMRIAVDDITKKVYLKIRNDENKKKAADLVEKG